MPSSITSKLAAPIALTMGDPAGVGPLLAAAAWNSRTERKIPPFILFGDPESFSAHGITIPTTNAAGDFKTSLPVAPVLLAARVCPGVPDSNNAPAIQKSIEGAVKAVQDGEASAVVTCPFHKKTLLDAGFRHAGHTGFLGELTGATPVMMLTIEDLKVVPVTSHVPLKDVSGLLTKDLIIKTAEITAADLTNRFGITRPRMAFTGLNPHAGEGGALGGEEIKTIIPAIRELQDRGFQASGPYPADTAFTPAMRMKFDVFFAMTHDQALIPVKTLDNRNAVNITLGLPIVRTSPAHGTAFDLLKEGRRPDPESFIQALLWAERLTQ